MTLYSFIKITDNNDPYTFIIECTGMVNPKARISCLRANLFSWEDRGCTGKYRDIWNFFFKDYSFYIVEKREFDNLNSARAYKKIIYNRYLAKLPPPPE